MSTAGSGPGPVPRTRGGERAALLKMLQETGGNQSEAARRYGVSRVTVWKRIKKHGIRIPQDLTAR